MNKINVPLCKPAVGERELAAIAAVFETGQLSHGSSVTEFEKQFATRVGTSQAVSLNSCASGLYLACLYIREKYGKGEIIVPTFTFPASANAIIFAGMVPRLVDVEWKTGNTSAALIEPYITEKTKAIMVVHYAGRPCDMPAIMNLADQHQLPVIEDSAECLGAQINGKEAGSFGIGLFSFYATKNMTTGEGGMIASNDEALVDWCRLKRAHGVKKGSYSRDDIVQPWFRQAITTGQNFRLSNFQAAMGIVQLNRLNGMNNARRIIAKQYSESLSDLNGVELPELLPLKQHSWQMYPIKVLPMLRDKLVIALNEKGIGASVHFDPPLHWQLFCKTDECFKTAEKLSLSTITLPISSVQTKEETDYVISVFRECFQKLIERKEY